MTGTTVLDHGWWIASRSAGIVAFVAVSISVTIGLLMANGLPRRRGAKKRLLAIHESTALAGLVAIAVHGVTLLGDPWLHPGAAGIAIPFAIGYRPVFTAAGIVAGWLAVLLGLSFYVRQRIGGQLWRRLHRATIAVWALGVVHVIGAGTDGSQPWMRGLLLATGVPIVALFARRILISRTPPARAPSRRRQPASSSA